MGTTNPLQKLPLTCGAGHLRAWPSKAVPVLVAREARTWWGRVYHSVSAKHLQGYLNEYAWRNNQRNAGRAMFDLLH